MLLNTQTEENSRNRVSNKLANESKSCLLYIIVTFSCYRDWTEGIWIWWSFSDFNFSTVMFHRDEIWFNVRMTWQNAIMQKPKSRQILSNQSELKHTWIWDMDKQQIKCCVSSGPTSPHLSYSTAYLHVSYPVRGLQGSRQQPFLVAVQNADPIPSFRTRTRSGTGLESPSSQSEQHEDKGRKNGPTFRHFKGLSVDGYLAAWLSR